MKRAQLNARAQEVLASETNRLSKLSYAQIAEWPEFPQTPNDLLQIPSELSEYRYTLMKDTQPDNSIRVAIQMYRYQFLGMGQMTADGFFLAPDGTLRRFTEKDLWAVT